MNTKRRYSLDGSTCKVSVIVNHVNDENIENYYSEDYSVHD